jgi:two-component system, cell cycle response regulator DivK
MSQILIAEDKPSSRELIRILLEANGHIVHESSDGEEALQKARQYLPDLIILDLQMPKLDGWGVAAELRKHPKFSRIPILALTASAMPADRDRALAAGCSAYLAKPVDFNFLRAEVERLLGAGQLRKHSSVSR